MPLRKIIHIDEEKCDGCGLCVPACAEGAIQIVQGKARLVNEVYCDGLGACLGECPQGAIRMEERDAADFDMRAVEAHLAAISGNEKGSAPPQVRSHDQVPSGCPGSMSRSFRPQAAVRPEDHAGAEQISRLGNWPLQLHLVPIQAPFYENADLLIAADCAPFAFAGFHEEFIAGKVVMIGCPKLDDLSVYIGKLTQVFASNNIRSIDVAFMEVPCCFGLVQLVQEAVARSGKDIPIALARLGIRGEIVQRAKSLAQCIA